MTWNEPPPTQIVQAVDNPVDHFSSRQLHEGIINATLSWQFDLTELNFNSLVIFFNGIALAGVGPAGQGPQPRFEKQFGIEWIPDQTFVRLIIFNVAVEENGTFTCQVTAYPVLGGYVPIQFKSNVQVDVVGKLQVKSRNIYM